MPTKEQQEFIRKRLIPHILREEGRGFTMEDWVRCLDRPHYRGSRFSWPAPACGMVMCIGGSIEFLLYGDKITDKGHPLRGMSVATCDRLPGAIGAVGAAPPGGTSSRMATIASQLGLTIENTYTLCYKWDEGWPEPYLSLYGNAKDPQEQARATVDLLEQIAQKGDVVFI